MTANTELFKQARRKGLLLRYEGLMEGRYFFWDRSRQLFALVDCASGWVIQWRKTLNPRYVWYEAHIQDLETGEQMCRAS